MSDNPQTYSEQLPSDALDKSRDVAKRLSLTARKLRLATSNRSNLFKTVGLRPRMINRVFSGALVAASLIFLIAPNVGAIVYYGYLASDQYQSEARFTVRSSSPAIGRDQLAKVTGLPSSKIVQDTQIVTNYISSGEILSDLAKKIDIKAIYQDPAADFIARLPPDANSEKLLDYWKGMVSTSTSPTSGIVTIKVRAFSPEASRDVLQQVVAASEAVVNGVNDRIWKDVIRTAQNNLKSSADQLQKAREQLTAARNKAGVLDVSGTSNILTGLISRAQQDLIDLQQRFDSAKAASISTNSPQMKVLQRQIVSKQEQIAALNAQVAGPADQASTKPNLADVSLDMSQLEMNQGLAERQFAASAKTVEQVQFISKQQLVYLDTFLAATLPDQAEYPKRMFWIGCTFAASLVTWAVVVGILSMLRNRMN